MNFQQYEIFRAIMETGSITAAGELLNLSQPSVSKYKMMLEHRLGLKLFSRKGNRLHPTAEGRALFEQVKRIYTGIDHLENYAATLKYSQGKSLSIAAIPLIAYRWLPREMALSMKERQDISLHLSLRNTEWIQGAVASRKIDFGIAQGRFDDSDFDTTSLMHLPMVCVCRPDHRFASMPKIHVEDLNGEQVVTLFEYDKNEAAMVRVFEAINPMNRLDVTSSHMACELVSQGMGVTITDALAAYDFRDSGLVMRPIEPAANLQISLLQSDHREASDLANSMIATLMERADALRTTITDRLKL